MYGDVAMCSKFNVVKVIIIVNNIITIILKKKKLVIAFIKWSRVLLLWWQDTGIVPETTTVWCDGCWRILSEGTEHKQDKGYLLQLR